MARTTALALIAVLLAGCGGAATGPTGAAYTPAAEVTPDPTIEDTPAPMPTPTVEPTPKPAASAAAFGVACTAAYDAMIAISSEVQTMIEAYLAGDAAKMLAQAGRVSLMAEQAVGALPPDYRNQTALRLFAERMAVMQTFTTLPGGTLDAGPFSDAMVELLDVEPALKACSE